MLDDWFSALMVLSAEKDLLESLAIDNILLTALLVAHLHSRNNLFMAELYLVIK